MDERNYRALLPHILGSRGRADITVTGYSMNPLIHEGDTVTLVTSDSYEVGDVLVFSYYPDRLTVHRLLKKDGMYHCKGDNTFRLESVTADKVLGRVTLINGEPIRPWPEWKIRLSYAQYLEFHQLGDSIPEAKKTDLWRFYSRFILEREDNNMLYRKNTDFDYIETDETSLAVFDPESGDTHFFNETGMDILKCIDEPCDLETLLCRLCEIYEATPDDIREDVIEFMADAVTKKVVIIK